MKGAGIVNKGAGIVNKAAAWVNLSKSRLEICTLIVRPTGGNHESDN